MYRGYLIHGNSLVKTLKHYLPMNLLYSHMLLIIKCIILISIVKLNQDGKVNEIIFNPGSTLMTIKT